MVLAGHKLWILFVFAMAPRPQQQSVQPEQLGAQRSGQSATEGVVAGPGDTLRGGRCGAQCGLFCFQLALQTHGTSHTQRFVAISFWLY